MPTERSQTSSWIPEAEYNQILAKVPIVCVDLLPLASIDSKNPGSIGLIFRETHDGKSGWCLIGGCIQRNEQLGVAVARHLKETLGTNFVLSQVTLKQLEIIEYFTQPELGEFCDPRKHAIGITYSAECQGQPVAQGEAKEFRWFNRDQLWDLEFGFGQGAVIEKLLRS